MENTVGSNLYNLLVTRDFEPELLDSSGKPVSDPNEAELFSFDFRTPERNYGTVVILLGTENELEVYYGDNLGRAMEGDDKSTWYDFLAQIKKFATRNLLSFDLNNINRLKYTMQGMAAIKEGLFEGYYGKKNISYSDQPKQTRLMIKHNRNLGEGEARYRAIESLFVETAEGERFRVPSRNLTHGRIMCRHVSEGGTPYDAFGQHINEIMSEMATLGRFIRAGRGRPYTGAAAEMVEDAVRHYQALKTKARKMIGKRGYTEARAEFDPAEIRDSETTVESIRNMFLEQSLDQRIEEALPILARMATSNSMREANEFESWSNRVMEGTWSLPETPEQMDQLADLLRNELPVGPDASNATEQLYDLIGDDELFDRLSELAASDPDADARPVIQARMAELGIDVPEDQETIDTSPEPDQAEPADAGPPVPTEENLDTDGVMMVKPSNMSSEGRESLNNSLARLLELARR